MSGYCRRLLPADAWVRFALVPVLVFVAMAADTGYLADFWHHLARGREIVAQGALLDHDIFTFTVPGEPFQDVNWLTQVIYFRLYQAGGLALVQVANALVLALTLAIVVAICRRRSGSMAVAMAVGVITFLGLWHVLTIRPQTFSLLLFVLVFDLLDRSRERPWLLSLMPILMALWANLHGAFPAGLMLLGGALVDAGWHGLRKGEWERFAALATCLAACMLATLANPYGWHIYGYVAETSSRAAARRIDEWVPPNLDMWIGRAFFASLILLATLTALCWRRYPPRRSDWIYLAMFLPLALGSARMASWWLLIAAPVLAELLAALWPTSSRLQQESTPNLGAGLTFVALILLAMFSTPDLRAYNPLLAARSDARVEHDLDAVYAKLCECRSTANVFTRLEWGEYLGWLGTRNHPVFMDGRIEIYPDKVWEEYSTVTLGRDGWQEVLDRYEVDALILDTDYHARTGLLDEVYGSSDWEQLLVARGAALYVRTLKGAHSKTTEAGLCRLPPFQTVESVTISR